MPLITNKQGAFLKAGVPQGCLLRAGSLVWSAPAAVATGPNFHFKLTAADTSAIAGFLGTQPTVNGNVLEFRDGPTLRGALAMPEFGGYCVMAIRFVYVPPSGEPKSQRSILHFTRNNNGEYWQSGPRCGLLSNTHVNNWMVEGDGGHMIVGALTENWTIVEMWIDNQANVFGRVDEGTVEQVPATAGTGSSNFIYFMENADGATNCDVAAIGIHNYLPDAAGQTAARNWASGFIPS